MEGKMQDVMQEFNINYSQMQQVISFRYGIMGHMASNHGTLTEKAGSNKLPSATTINTQEVIMANGLVPTKQKDYFHTSIWPSAFIFYIS